LDTIKNKEPQYEMFSKAGNKRCHTLTLKVCKKIFSDKRMAKAHIIMMLRDGIDKIQESYPEVQDSEPPGHIAFYVNRALEKAGYNFEVERYDFS